MNDSNRYREWRREELTAEQQEVFDRIAAPRGGVVPAPFHIFIESPRLASSAQEPKLPLWILSATRISTLQKPGRTD